MPTNKRELPDVDPNLKITMSSRTEPRAFPAAPPQPAPVEAPQAAVGRSRSADEVGGYFGEPKAKAAASRSLSVLVVVAVVGLAALAGIVILLLRLFGG